jgi:broad specificity phosphatase PhoE
MSNAAVSVTVTVLRHAETASNASGIYMGSLDVPATDKGLAEAAALTGLQLERYDGLVTSPLIRASATLEAIAPHRQIDSDLRLAERGLGDWEGVARVDVPALSPWAFSAEGMLDATVTPPNGEPFDRFCERISSFLSEKMERGIPVLAVTHNGWIRTARYLLGEIAVEQIFAEAEPYLVPLALPAVGLRRL